MRQNRWLRVRLATACTTGRLRWLSALARPWPGMCLSTGSTPPSSSPSATAAAMRRDLVRRLAVGAVADHAVGAAHRHVGQRQAIDVDAERLEIGRDQPRAEPGRPQALSPCRARRARHRPRRADRPASAAGPRRCTRPPSWSTRTGVPAMPIAVRESCTRRSDLGLVLDVPLEQDQAPRTGLAQERALVRRERRAGQPRMKARAAIGAA